MTLSFYCQGLHQSTHGTNTNSALINLHRATRQIGKPGAGSFSLTGQLNAMGGREVGGMANLLPAHSDLDNPQHRDEIAHLWSVDSLPAQPGKNAVELFEAVRQGEIKLLWTVCTNPAYSMPDQTLVREAFESTDTMQYADVPLPATSWGEKEGTTTNSERRINQLHAAIPGPGEARGLGHCVDFACRLAWRLGKRAALFDYDSVEDIFEEHAETTCGRDFNITGLSYALLNSRGPQQWPYAADAQGGRKRLYEDGRFANAKHACALHRGASQSYGGTPGFGKIGSFAHGRGDLPIPARLRPRGFAPLRRSSAV